jgi:hypothetical protein
MRPVLFPPLLHYDNFFFIVINGRRPRFLSPTSLPFPSPYKYYVGASSNPTPAFLSPPLSSSSLSARKVPPSCVTPLRRAPPLTAAPPTRSPLVASAAARHCCQALLLAALRRRSHRRYLLTGAPLDAVSL